MRFTLSQSEIQTQNISWWKSEDALTYTWWKCKLVHYSGKHYRDSSKRWNHTTSLHHSLVSAWETPGHHIAEGCLLKHYSFPDRQSNFRNSYHRLTMIYRIINFFMLLFFSFFSDTYFWVRVGYFGFIFLLILYCQFKVISTYSSL